MATRTPKIPARSTLLNSSLDGMDDLFDFKTKEDLSQPEQENGGTGITEMDFAVMEPLPNHKFKLYTGQRLWDMVDSIREFGILEPLIVWVHDGKNTILSGHNRQNAGSIAGLTKGPVIIRENLTYEDAILIATETNLRQRSFDDLSPSEKAYCLKQHYDAIKSQGRRNDLIKEIEEFVNPHETGKNGTSLENPKKSDAGVKRERSVMQGIAGCRSGKYCHKCGNQRDAGGNKAVSKQSGYDEICPKGEEKTESAGSALSFHGRWCQNCHDKLSEPYRYDYHGVGLCCVAWKRRCKCGLCGEECQRYHSLSVGCL